MPIKFSVMRPGLDLAWPSWSRLALASASFLITVACGPSPVHPSSAREIIGADGRQDYYEVTPHWQRLADASFALIRKDNLVQDGDVWRFSPKVKTYRDWGHLCEGVRFAEQPAPADCSGFLVGDGIAMTARHCIPDRGWCEHFAVVFDFKVSAAGQLPLEFKADQVAQCEEVLMTGGDDADWSAFRLNVSTKKRGALALRTQGHPHAGDAVTIIGYPHGIPVKIASGATVQYDGEDGDQYIEADVDAFSGNSGSPVINDVTGLVEGIDVVGFGEWDKSKNSDGSACKKPAQRDADTGAPSWLTPATKFAAQVLSL